MSESREGVYLFCVAPSGARAPGPALAGYGGEPIQAISLSPLVLWIQPLRTPPPRTADSVLTHHRVVEEAWRTASALAPMRFGQWFRDREALAEALEPRLEALAAGLERVRGAGEHAVRIAEAERAPTGAAAEAPEADTPGRAHMEALARRERRWLERAARGRELAEDLAARLGALVRDQRVEPLREGGMVSVAHLVERTAEEAYADAVDRFAAERRSLRVVRGGPWPPYSFVS
ncbi:MAG: GvpL/GvpF family gas vesicle protein [Gemmatimonadetes bacterium]|nr:GvpL/GvpF family gas vesicle protein [Gemmatimonadota bacterium]